MTPLALVQRELQMLEQAQVLMLAQVPEREQRQERAAQPTRELVQPEPQGLLTQALEPPELHVFLERLPLRQGSTQHI